MNVNTHPVAPPFQFTYSQHLHVQNIFFCMSVRDHTVSVLINPIVPHKPNLLLFFVTELSHGPKRIKKNWGKFSRTYPVFVL